MKIKDACAHQVARIDRNESLRDAAEELASAEIGVLAVDDGYGICGVIGERDIVRAVFDGVDLDATRVWEYMADAVVSVEEDASIEDAIAKMHSAQVRHVLVTGHEDFVGVISTRDLLRVLAPDTRRIRQAL